MWLGHSAYLEIADGAVVDFGGATSHVDDGHGWIAVDEIRMSDNPAPENVAPHAGSSDPRAKLRPHQGNRRAAGDSARPRRSVWRGPLPERSRSRCEFRTRRSPRHTPTEPG